MPTYEYACTQCGQHTEVVQSFSDAPLEICPSCGGALRKVFAPVGIVLKGSGFYKTDSRSSSTATTPAGTSSSKESTPASTPTSSDSSSSASSSAPSTPASSS